MREAGDSLLDDLSNKLPWTTAVHFDHWTNISWAVQTNSVARCCLYIQAFPLQTTVALISTANGFHSFKVWVVCQPTHLMGDMSSVGNARPPKIPWTPPWGLIRWRGRACLERCSGYQWIAGLSSQFLGSAPIIGWSSCNMGHHMENVWPIWWLGHHLPSNSFLPEPGTLALGDGRFWPWATRAVTGRRFKMWSRLKNGVAMDPQIWQSLANHQFLAEL